MTPSEIAQRLADRVIDVAHHLLPSGKREGAEWRVGSVNGEKGQSLGVHLKGEKAGVWCDFSTGETGDLLDLWRAVRGWPRHRVPVPAGRRSDLLEEARS